MLLQSRIANSFAHRDTPQKQRQAQGSRVCSIPEFSRRQTLALGGTALILPGLLPLQEQASFAAGPVPTAALADGLQISRVRAYSFPYFDCSFS